MTETNTNQEEVTTIENRPVQQIVKRTSTQQEPQARGEAPQKVYEKKKNIFRVNQIVWYILGFIEILLLFRFALKILGANPNAGFTNLIYTITTPLIIPFRGILGTYTIGNSVIEWSILVAAIVYLCIAWGLAYLLNIVYPITPKDIETE